MPNTRVRGTPFDHYKADPQPKPQENPYRFVHKKLGLSEEEFEARILKDIDDLLNDIEADKAPEPEEPPAPTEIPLPIVVAVPECPISQDECYRMLCNQTLTTGTQLGNYMWAIGLGKCKYNFEMKSWDKEIIALLDAYDPNA